MRRLVLAVLLVGCSHETATPGSDAGALPTTAALASAAPSGPAAAGSAAGTGRAQAAGAAGATGKARAVSGPYQAAKGTFYIPDSGGWSGVKWPGDDDPSGVGAGTLALQIAADGRVSGTISGALGDLTVDGMDRDGQLTAQLLPAPGAPIHSFTGTLIARDDGTKVTGTMRLSDGINRLVRVADVALVTAGS